MSAIVQIVPAALRYVPNPHGEGYVPLSPFSGEPMVRACKPKNVVFKGVQQTYLQPGWYDLATGFTVYNERDSDVERRMTDLLRSRVDGAGHA